MTNFLHNLVQRGAGMTATIAAPPVSPFAAAVPESVAGNDGAEEGFALEEAVETPTPQRQANPIFALSAAQNAAPPRNAAVNPVPLLREIAGREEAANLINSPSRLPMPERFAEGTTSVDAANALFAVNPSLSPTPRTEELSPRPPDGKTEASAPFAEESREREARESSRSSTLVEPIVAAENRTLSNAPTPIPPAENAAAQGETAPDAGALTPVVPRQAGGDFWERGEVFPAMREAPPDAPAPPRVEVRIGKIEVKMNRPQEPLARPAAPSGRRGFDEYARVRRGLGRSGR